MPKTKTKHPRPRLTLRRLRGLITATSYCLAGQMEDIGLYDDNPAHQEAWKELEEGRAYLDDLVAWYQARGHEVFPADTPIDQEGGQANG